MPNMDLQIQTPYSDGRGSIAEIMRIAKASDLDLLAITDHDTVDGIPEFLHDAKEAGIDAVPGIELSTSEHGKVLHLLAFNIDWKHPELLAVLERRFGERHTSAAAQPERRISNTSKERFKELYDIYEAEKNPSAITLHTDEQDIDAVFRKVQEIIFR